MSAPSASQAKVSIITATYNRLAFLQEAIASVQAQTYPHWEHIIINDGSTDGTQAFLDSYACDQSNIHVTHKPHEANYARALNLGLSQASGAYVFTLDDDDIAHKDLIATCVARLEQLHVSYFAISFYSNYLLMNSQGVILEDPREYELPPLVFRTAALRALNGWDEFYRRVEDTNLLERARQRGYKHMPITDILYDYRQIGKKSLLRSPETPAWRYVHYASLDFAQWYGSFALTKQAKNFQGVLDIIWGRKPCLPYIVGQHVRQSTHINFGIFNKRHLSDFLKEIHKLGYVQPQFPYRPLWKHLRLFWHMIRRARWPFLYRWRGLCLISKLYFPSRIKQRYWHDYGKDNLERDKQNGQWVEPKISVGFVVQKNATALRHMLEQLAQQDCPDWELLLVGSRASRRACALAEQAARTDKRIHWLPSYVRLEPIAAAHYACAVAQAPYFCRWDVADDVPPDYLSRALAFLATQSGPIVLGIPEPRIISRMRAGYRVQRDTFWQPMQATFLGDTLWRLADMELWLRAERLGIYAALPHVSSDPLAIIPPLAMFGLRKGDMLTARLTQLGIARSKNHCTHILGPWHHLKGRACHYPYQVGYLLRLDQPQSRQALWYRFWLDRLPWLLTLKLYWEILRNKRQMMLA